ncbi:MAG: biopolymer transporter ExbD [Verrucomicrobiota bacterium]
MKRLGWTRESGSDAVDINLSPLIDVVFLLLIFFVVTTVFVEETGVEVQKPTAASAKQLEKKSILFALTENGDIMYGGRAITLNAVRGIVTRQLREWDAPVILIGDKQAQLGLLVELIDECKLAGAKQVSIAARREP